MDIYTKPDFSKDEFENQIVSGTLKFLQTIDIWKERCLAAEAEVERLKAERLKLDKRIHNQRVALRQTWEVVEMRRKWLGSDTARRMYINLLKRYQALKGLK